LTTRLAGSGIAEELTRQRLEATNGAKAESSVGTKPASSIGQTSRCLES
jgi:hypothetical protein